MYRRPSVGSLSRQGDQQPTIAQIPNKNVKKRKVNKKRKLLVKEDSAVSLGAIQTLRKFSVRLKQTKMSWHTAKNRLGYHAS